MQTQQGYNRGGKITLPQKLTIECILEGHWQNKNELPPQSKKYTENAIKNGETRLLIVYNGNNKTKTLKEGIPPMAIISQQTFFMWNDLNEFSFIENRYAFYINWLKIIFRLSSFKYN